jgi:two-component system, cell cycle response regulator DivK
MDSRNEIPSINEIAKINDWTGKTILVADDIHTNFLLFEAIMKRTNVRLIWARNGREAVEMCLDHEFIDLVLMDIEMPEMNGIEAAREIKKNRKSIPIIAQTAFADFYSNNEIMQAGCSQIINKPLMSENIIATISRYI